MFEFENGLKFNNGTISSPLDLHGMEGEQLPPPIIDVGYILPLVFCNERGRNEESKIGCTTKEIPNDPKKNLSII